MNNYLEVRIPTEHTQAAQKKEGNHLTLSDQAIVKLWLEDREIPSLYSVSQYEDVEQTPTGPRLRISIETGTNEEFRFYWVYFKNGPNGERQFINNTPIKE